MNNEQLEYVEQQKRAKEVRPVLIVSNDTVSEYGIPLRHLLAGLADESVSVVVVCPPNCDVEPLVTPGSEVIRHPAIDVVFMARRNRRILIEQLLRFKPTVLHCLSHGKALLARNLAKQLAVPYVLSINKLQKRFSRLSISAKRCAKIIVASESIASNVAEVYPRFASRVEKINVGTFAAESANCFSDLSRMASIVVSTPAKYEPSFDNLFGAVRHLAIDGYEFMLVIIGGLHGDKQLRSRLRTLGLLNHVINVPPQVPWRSVLAAGDIFVQPFTSDAFNPLLLEAMSVGAVVAGCKGGVDDLLIDGQTCVLFDPDDELNIYGRLKQLFDRHEQARQLAGNAQENLRENYQVSTMVSETLRVYSEV